MSLNENHDDEGSSNLQAEYEGPEKETDEVTKEEATTPVSIAALSAKSLDEEEKAERTR